MSDTIVEPYNVLTFKPLMKINEELLINIPQKLHGSTVGKILPLYLIAYQHHMTAAIRNVLLII